MEDDRRADSRIVGLFHGAAEGEALIICCLRMHERASLQIGDNLNLPEGC